MSKEELRWCSRCHCSVPLTEWQVLRGAVGVKHVGPMRDHDIDTCVDPDENGEAACNFVESILHPEEVTPDER